MFNVILKIGLTVLLIFAPIARGAVRIWSITPVLLIIYTLLFLWLWQLIKRPKTKDRRLKTTELNRPILAFIILAIISCIFSIYKYASSYSLLVLFA